MSAENLLNSPSEAVEKAPAIDSYTPMGDAWVPPKEPEKTFDGGEQGLRKAAKEVTEQRQEREPEPIEREYKFLGGEHDGEPVPMNQTISAERAADDLTRQRGFEAAELSPTADQVAGAIDQAR